MSDELKTNALLDLSHTDAAELFEKTEYPWEVFTFLSDFLLVYAERLPLVGYYSPSPGVFIAQSAKVAPGACICPPCVIGPDTEIRHSAYIRGSVLIGSGAVIGNSSELKNCIIFDKAQVPHYNYVGDSVLGYRAHMGAGSILSNVKSDKTDVSIRFNEQRIGTGLRKFGAILGDYAEIGCGAVLNPGTVIGRNSVIYPLTPVRGYVPPDCIMKNISTVVRKKVN